MGKTFQENLIGQIDDCARGKSKGGMFLVTATAVQPAVCTPTGTFVKKSWLGKSRRQAGGGVREKKHLTEWGKQQGHDNLVLLFSETINYQNQLPELSDTVNRWIRHKRRKSPGNGQRHV
ncbi:hypothetical protein RUM44_010210 [Polyplax serrata]|uniref:Uncharacterized protein n=1 Tax=Polyplax serrata TaxID=468196 RepID=A0ABR1AUX4_POLSC